MWRQIFLKFVPRNPAPRMSTITTHTITYVSIHVDAFWHIATRDCEFSELVSTGTISKYILLNPYYVYENSIL